MCWYIHPEVKLDIYLEYQVGEACIYLQTGGHDYVPSDELRDDLLTTNDDGGVIVRHKLWLFVWQTEVYFGKEYKERIKFF